MRLNRYHIQHASRNTVKHTTIIAIFISLLLVMPTITIVVQAEDIIVDDDGTGDYTSIQDAIDSATANTTIWVKDGSYNDPITVDVEGLKIIANNGDEPSLLLTSYAPGIDIQASNVVIEGFKIYGNTQPSGAPTIRVSAGANAAKIRENTFKVIESETGNIATLLEPGVSEIRFTNNNVYDFEKGVSLGAGSDCYISGNFFSNVNYSKYHGATIQGTSTWYGTIQDAIDLAMEDDTVSVEPGLFSEIVHINKSLTFNGVKAGDNPNGGRSGEETILDGNTVSPIRIDQETENVTIDGFTLTIPNKSPISNQAGVMIGPGTKNIIVKNNIFENITDGSGDDTTSDETYGVMVWGRDDSIGGQSNIEIKNNLIQDVEEYGIAINDNTSHVTISGNTVRNLIGSDHSTEGFPPWLPSWPNMVCSAIHLGGQVGPIHNITINDNILTTFVTGDGTSTFAGSGISLAGVDEWLSTRTWQGFNDIYISNNKITNNTMGIAALAGNSTGEITVHDQTDTNDGNNLSGNTEYGINNFVDDLFINATNNWWGDITGPYNVTNNDDGLGIRVEGNVSFWT